MLSEDQNKQIEYVLRSVQDRDVKFVRLWFTDVLGVLKSVAITPSELETAFYEGIGFDGSTIEGPVREIEKDMIAKPDPATFQVLPWRGSENVAARMFCDVYTPDNEKSLADSRNVLRRVLDKASQEGLTFYAHPELEFYLFKQSGKINSTADLIPIDDGGYFDHVPRSVGQDFRRDVINTLEKMGISVEFSHHEAGPGQNEIDLRYADALTTADNIMTFRTVVKEIALQYDMFASFMPKPLANFPGSAMHTHMSLFEGENNIFYDVNSRIYNLSNTGQQFIAGIIKYASEISAVTNQFINSYKRLSNGDEAPSFACWGANNPSALIRIPKHKPSKAHSARVEVRSIDSASNPYLSFAVILGAGLKGIDEGLTLPEETSEDLFKLSRLEKQSLPIKQLPKSLEEALTITEKSDLVADIFGEDLFETFINNKYYEWEQYRKQITDFEINYSLSKI